MARTKQETYNLILTKRPTLDDYREHYNENPELETVLPFQQVVNERQQFLDIVRRWANNEIEFNEDFMLKYSPTSRDKSYPFQNVGYGFMQKYESFLRTIPVKLNQSQGHDYNEFIRDSKNVNFSLPRKAIEPIEITSRNIHLSRILFDSNKKENYFTTTHINQPFKIEDIEYFKSLPNDYYVQDGNTNPLTAISGKLYFSETSIDDKDSLKSSFQISEEKKEVQIDTYTYTTAQGEQVTLKANGKSEQEVFKEFKEQEKISEPIYHSYPPDMIIIDSVKVEPDIILSNNNINGKIVLSKVPMKWNAYYNDRNLQLIIQVKKGNLRINLENMNIRFSNNDVMEKQINFKLNEDMKEGIIEIFLWNEIGRPFINPISLNIREGQLATKPSMFDGITIGSIIAGALGITFLMSTLNKRGRY